MIERILFPTDGSPLSDRAIPALELIASAQGADVYLAQVVSPPVWTATDGGGYGTYDSISPELYEQVLAELDRQAQQNLARLAEQLQAHKPPIRSQAHLFHGSSYASLLDEEQDVKPGLVVMATHGRTGLARFVRGSVADAMVREGTAPVLLVRSFGREVTSLQHALVPLDGSAVAEGALGMVEMLAHRPLEGVHLLQVVQQTDEKADAGDYLNRVASHLKASGVEVRADVQTGAPWEVIADVAETLDVVIMATHGRSGLNRLRHGSVAERVLRDAPVPLLLVRAGGLPSTS